MNKKLRKTTDRNNQLQYFSEADGFKLPSR